METILSKISSNNPIVKKNSIQQLILIRLLISGRIVFKEKSSFLPFMFSVIGKQYRPQFSSLKDQDEFNRETEDMLKNLNNDDVDKSAVFSGFIGRTSKLVGKRALFAGVPGLGLTYLAGKGLLFAGEKAYSLATHAARKQLDNAENAVDTLDINMDDALEHLRKAREAQDRLSYIVEHNRGLLKDGHLLRLIDGEDGKTYVQQYKGNWENFFNDVSKGETFVVIKADRRIPITDDIYQSPMGFVEIHYKNTLSNAPPLSPWPTGPALDPTQTGYPIAPGNGQGMSSLDHNMAQGALRRINAPALDPNPTLYPRAPVNGEGIFHPRAPWTATSIYDTFDIERDDLLHITSIGSRDAIKNAELLISNLSTVAHNVSAAHANLNTAENLGVAEAAKATGTSLVETAGLSLVLGILTIYFSVKADFTKSHQLVVSVLTKFIDDILVSDISFKEIYNNPENIPQLLNKNEDAKGVYFHYINELNRFSVDNVRPKMGQINFNNSSVIQHYNMNTFLGVKPTMLQATKNAVTGIFTRKNKPATAGNSSQKGGRKLTSKNKKKNTRKTKH
jgi:hypothetical protein